MKPDERRLREELAQHLAALTADYKRQGMSPKAAHRAARLKLGGEEQIRVLWRDARRWAWLEHWVRDLRLAARSLRRSPGYAAAVIITLALAIAANAAMFSAADAFLLRPLPYAQPQRLATVMAQFPSSGEFPLSGPMFRAWRVRNHSFSAMAALKPIGGVLTGRGQATQLTGEAVSANMFSLLGVHPALGRFFMASEDRPYADAGTDAIVISHKLFESEFDGQASALGSIVHLSGKAYTLVGVVPKGFVFPPGDTRDYWITMAVWAEPSPQWPQPKDSYWGTMYLAAIGRLRPGVTVAAAARDLNGISKSLRGDRKISHDIPNAYVAPFHQDIVSFISPLLRMLWAGAALILLIACANLAGLGLARGIVLLPSLRVRAALGARPRDLLRSLLSETVILAAAGCALGFVVAVPIVHVLEQGLGAPAFMPSVDLRLLLFTIGMGVLAAIIMGCWPAWFVSRGAVTSSGNRVTEHRAQRSRGALVAAEVALALLLVASAGLIGRSLYGLARTDPGFNPQGVLAVDLALPQSMPLARRPVVLQSFLDRVRALPGVAAAGAGVEQPWGGIQDTGSVDGNVSIVTSAITPGYFHAIEAHLLRGRLFSRQDTAHTAQVVIVNQRLVQKLRAAKPSFPGRAVGASITWAGSKPWTIVSVVGNIVLPGQPPHARAYFPQAQVPDFNDLYVAIRVNRGNPMDLLSAVRNQLAEVNPNLALGSPHLLVANRANWEAQPESAAEIAAAFGVLALLLAATGLYGLIAYAVRQRERELGVRMALGARRRDIYKLILSMGLRLTAIGLAAGFAGIYLARGVLASQLYGLSPLDPLTLLAAVVILTAVALLAAFWPARRAARADPMRALRAE